MEPNPSSPSNARYRPFRGAAWALYLFVSVGFSSLVIYSVTRSVFQMSPTRPPPATARGVESCASELSGLFDTLANERQALSGPRAAEADVRWLAFRTGWLVRLRELEAECALDDDDRKPLKAAFAQLHHVMNLATVEATQLSGQLGPALDAFRQKLGALPGQQPPR
ncbi:MAG: hypothetical protein IAE78_00425 [Myxococcus sp.]|nr:hypothetical protein [Myxococcus sp.]